MLFALLGEIDKYENVIPDEEKDYPTDFERLHISSCARIGYMFAQERGVDPDLAAAACAMHDYGRIITGRQHDHAEVGYLPAMEFLRGTGTCSADDVLRHMEYIINLCGEDHLAFGCDLDGAETPSDLPDVASLTTLLPKMQARGYSEDRIEKLFYKNACRFLVNAL